jgi:excisionase family DNA binding protein
MTMRLQSADPMAPAFYTVGQIAELMNVSRRTVHRWISTGSLAVHRFDSLVRISATDLEAFFAVSRCAHQTAKKRPVGQ